MEDDQTRHNDQDPTGATIPILIGADLLAQLSAYPAIDFLAEILRNTSIDGDTELKINLPITEVLKYVRVSQATKLSEGRSRPDNRVSQGTISETISKSSSTGSGAIDHPIDTPAPSPHETITASNNDIPMASGSKLQKSSRLLIQDDDLPDIEATLYEAGYERVEDQELQFIEEPDLVEDTEILYAESDTENTLAIVALETPTSQESSLENLVQGENFPEFVSQETISALRDGNIEFLEEIVDSDFNPPDRIPGHRVSSFGAIKDALESIIELLRSGLSSVPIALQKLMKFIIDTLGKLVSTALGECVRRQVMTLAPLPRAQLPD
ncbi:hypothetical protein TWF106_004910 [Orbilia oligospora]|uniref:Uncharacterized protein n=1 Tax=Orbilia oligospora TaxID=2813651 RepID=A0A7C8UXH9_ORBOL|nr:hypothetical protein TWF106_004910 [Orbilia oligospora]